MKKNSFLCSAIVAMAAIIGLASCNNGKSEREAQLESQIDSLAASDSIHQEDIMAMADFVNVMSTGLDSITAQEGVIRSGQDAEGKKIDKAHLREQLQTLSGLLDRQRQRIGQLENRIEAGKKSGKANSAYIAKLEKLISYYKQQIEEKDKQIADLNEQLNQKNANIAQLTQSVSSLTTSNTALGKTVENQRSTIESQDQTLHTAFVAVGSSKKLKELGLIKGGFLAKKKVNTSELDVSKFEKVDIRNYNNVTINSSSPKIMTQMPDGSYEITKNSNGTSTLHITDVTLFWSVSKYLIIKL